MAGQGVDLFDAYFRRADLDRDGRITGSEAVAFFQFTNLPKQVLAQIWTYADQHKTGFLGRNEFYNALKLVTVAQSKRDLTPEIVKAALFGPASAKIPAPVINPAATPAPPTTAVSPQFGAANLPPSQNMSVTAQRGPANANMGQQFYPSHINQMGRPPRPGLPTPVPYPQQGGAAASQLPSTGISSTWRGGAPTNLAGQSTPVSARDIIPSTQHGHGTTQVDTSSAQLRPQGVTGMMQLSTPKEQNATLPPSNVGGQNSKSQPVSGNGFASDSIFGDGFSVTAPQPKQDATGSAFSASGLSASASTGAQTTVKPNSLGQHLANQHQQVQPITKGNQQVPVQNLSTSSIGFAAGPGNSVSGQPQVSWPRMTPTDVQKYNKVFVEVDSDRDGKITGEQARNLFLSWRLPREILKQVWDLSDQDNDSMLSLREFCIALYLMERFREGRPLPRTLPGSIMIDEAMLPASGRQAAAYGNTTWRPTPGLQHQQAPSAARPPIPHKSRPPTQGPLPLPEEVMQPAPQKSKVPVLEKHLVNQLSEQEQNSLNTKFNEATEANRKILPLDISCHCSRSLIDLLNDCIYKAPLSRFSSFLP